MIKDLKFTVDSALLQELGEKLVETVHLALSELVKNAYDADATKVEVVFEIKEDGNTRLKIVDDGIGMNFEAVQNFWMRIATTNKYTKSTSSFYGRQLTGAKGIGRFSCRRLGRKLTLITKGTRSGDLRGIQENIEESKVVFPWTTFESGKDVTTIVCSGEQTIIEKGQTGTTLIIDDIVDEWTTRGLNWLKRNLAVLTANRGAKRDGFPDDPGFLILLNAPDFEEGVRDLRSDLINAGWGTLKARLNSKHQAVCEINALGIGRRTITSDKKFSMLEGTTLEVGIMVEIRSQMRDLSILSKGNLQKILSDWGGVQVRHNGFRVHPYGNDDWLKIDKDRGLRKASPKDELFLFAESLRGVVPKKSLLNQLSSSSYIGNVDIGTNSSGFEMKASREGFIESESMEELKNFVRFAIHWSTILREYYIRQEELKIAERTKVRLENLVDEPLEERQVVQTAELLSLSLLKKKLK